MFQMLKYFQTKMFLAGNIPTKDQMQFGDFRSCLSIVNNSTNLQNKKNRNKENTYLAPTNRPTCRPSPAAAPASCLARPGRQAGVRRRHQRAPRSCPPPCFASSPPCCPGRSPRRAPTPLDTSISPLPHSLAPLRHGRRHRRRSAVVAVATVVPAPPDRVHSLRRRRLRRTARAPSARVPRSHRTDLVFTEHRRRSLSPSPPHQLVSDRAVWLIVTDVSIATSPSSPFLFPCTTTSTRSSPARTAVELVADVSPA